MKKFHFDFSTKNDGVGGYQNRYKFFLKTSPIFAQKNKPIYGRFIFSSTFAGISFPCVDYLFDYLLITELPKRPIYRHFQEQITGIEPAFPAWEASVLPMNHICKRNIRYYTPCSFILPVLIFTIFTFLPFYLFAYPFYLSRTPNHFRAFQMPSLSTSVVI